MKGPLDSGDGTGARIAGLPFPGPLAPSPLFAAAWGGGLSMSACLDALAPEIERAPTVKAAAERLRAVAARLPLCSPAAFEIRLGSPSRQVDLALRLPRGPLELGPATEGAEEWRRIAALARLPQGRGSRVRAVDLEFDLPPEGPPLPLPRVFLELDGRPGAQAVRRLAGELVGHHGLDGALRLCHGALPPGGSVIHLGCGPGRPQGALRLVVSGVAPERRAGFLSRIGWPEEPGIIPELAGRFPRVRIDLALDLAGGRIERVGFECFPDPRDGAQEWPPFLRRLVEAGCCLPERARELAGWSALGRGPGELAVTSFPSHVKVAADRRGGLEVKGYLGLWIDGARADGQPV